MGAPDWVDVFPIKNGDIPASYVSLPKRKCEGLIFWKLDPILNILGPARF